MNKYFSKNTKTWLWLFLLFTVIALFNWMRFVNSELAEGGSGKVLFFFIMETTGAYSVLVLLPAVLWFFNHFPLKRENLLTRIPFYLLISFIYGLIHTFLMFFSRTVIYYFADWGSYDYGLWQYRIPMEYSHQFFTFWTIYFVNLYIKNYRQKQQQELRTKELEEQLTRARLQTLQMQLNPHFLFNTLNLISSTLYENVEAADKMIANLSDLLRVTLKESGSKEHTLKKELHILKLYLNIMKARFADNLNVNTNIEANTEQGLMPTFILQPLVENSIYHNRDQQDLQIGITAKKNSSNLEIIISDNGKGLDMLNNTTENSKGIGLSNTAQRLETLYGEKHYFSLQSGAAGGVVIKMKIPWHTK